MAQATAHDTQVAATLLDTLKRPSVPHSLVLVLEKLTRLF